MTLSFFLSSSPAWAGTRFSSHYLAPDSSELLSSIEGPVLTSTYLWNAFWKFVAQSGVDDKASLAQAVEEFRNSHPSFKSQLKILGFRGVVDDNGTLGLQMAGLVIPVPVSPAALVRSQTQAAAQVIASLPPANDDQALAADGVTVRSDVNFSDDTAFSALTQAVAGNDVQGMFNALSMFNLSGVPTSLSSKHRGAIELIAINGLTPELRRLALDVLLIRDSDREHNYAPILRAEIDRGKRDHELASTIAIVISVQIARERPLERRDAALGVFRQVLETSEDADSQVWKEEVVERARITLAQEESKVTPQEGDGMVIVRNSNMLTGDGARKTHELRPTAGDMGSRRQHVRSDSDKKKKQEDGKRTRRKKGQTAKDPRPSRAITRLYQKVLRLRDEGDLEGALSQLNYISGMREPDFYHKAIQTEILLEQAMRLDDPGLKRDIFSEVVRLAGRLPRRGIRPNTSPMSLAYNLAHAYYHLKRYDKAEQLQRKLLNQDPNNYLQRAFLARILLHAGKPQQAFDAINIAMEWYKRGKRIPPYRLYADILWKLDRADEAREVLELLKQSTMSGDGVQPNTLDVQEPVVLYTESRAQTPAQEIADAVPSDLVFATRAKLDRYALPRGVVYVQLIDVVGIPYLKVEGWVVVPSNHWDPANTKIPDPAAINQAVEEATRNQGNHHLDLLLPIDPIEAQKIPDVPGITVLRHLSRQIDFLMKQLAPRLGLVDDQIGLEVLEQVLGVFVDQA